MNIDRRGRASAFLVGLFVVGIAAHPSPALGLTERGVVRPAVIAAQVEVDDEAVFVARINELRIGLGLEPLAVHPLLVPQARDWAATLRRQGSLSHAADLSIGIDLPWTRLGENVGVAPAGEIDALFDAFVASPSHYANLVKSDYRYIGVGVVYGADGRIWTAHRFMALDEAAVTTTSTAPPTATTTPRRATTVPPAPVTTTPPSSTTTTTPAEPTSPSTTPPPSADPATIRSLSSPAVARIAFDLALAGI